MELQRGLVKTSAGYIHYRQAGKGKTIILLHPSQQSSAMYLELMQVLSTKLKVIAIDYPSFGMSDHVKGKPTMSDYAKWIIEVLNNLKISKASFAGEAFGAALSVTLANLYPQKTQKIILLNCPYYPDKDAPQRSHGALKAGLRPEDPSGFPMTRTLEFVLEKDPEHIPLHPSQSWMDRINVAQIEAGRDRWQVLDALHEFDMIPNLQKLSCQVLCMWGDHFIYAKDKDAFVKHIKNCKALIIKDSRFSIHWEQSELVGNEILRFLDVAK